MRMWMLMVSIAVALLGLFAPPASAGDAHHERGLSFTLPLNHGRLRVADILKEVADRVGGLPAELATVAVASRERHDVPALDWSINVQSFAGRAQIAALERLAGGAVHIDIAPDHVTVRLDESRLAGLVKSEGRGLDRWLADVMKFQPQAVSVERDRFGLTFITATDARAGAADLTDAMRQRVVVLVHGLDDPGVMWTDLIPALHSAGFTVGRFEYPDDGPISESADLLARCLRDARAAGIARLDIVAHSMGGLVARDVLTRSAYYAGDGSGSQADGQLPAVDRLIMLGPPNHGSKLARFRGLAELREHLLPALLTGKSLRELGESDGNGEAGVDLLPDSDFLRRLNARALPTHTQCTIVAARWMPVDARSVSWTLGELRKLAGSSNAPQWLRQSAGSSIAGVVEREADRAVEEIGDGCVSLDSAHLDGVSDFTVVRANHLSMILNIGGGSRTPLAVPIVLDRLGRPPNAQQ